MSETTPIPVVQLVPGTVVAIPDDIGFAVNIAGTTPPVWWQGAYIPDEGDAVRVLMVDGTAYVLGPAVPTAHPPVGVVAGSASGGYLAVTVNGVPIDARYTGAPPDVGTLVRLDWQGAVPWIWPDPVAPLDSERPVVPIKPPDPPPVVVTGTLSVAANDSQTYSSPGGWSSYYGKNLAQGSYSGRSYSGSWFYGAAAAQLAGRTVTGLRIRIGARLHMGAYNASLPLNFYLHTSSAKPAGDVSRTDGPYTVTLAPNNPAGWVTLPTAWGPTIVAGGGVGIAGGTYGGVSGVVEDPASGTLALDWKR